MDGSVCLFNIILFAITCDLLCDSVLAHTETVRVERLHKTTKANRYKRDTEKYADFPSTLMYDLHMKDIRVPLRLRKHHTSLPAVTITSTSGETYQYDRSKTDKISYGMYTDPVTSAIIAVSFDDITGESRLYGNFYLHDETWQISPADINNPKMSHVVEKLEQTSGVRKLPTQLSKSAVPEQGKGVFSVDQVTANHLKDADLNVTRAGQSKRYKRQVPVGCNVIETAVLVDETIVEFHMNLTGGDFNAAVMSINMYYSVIFTEVDLRYCALLDIECVRVYLSEVIIPEPNTPVWTADQVRGDGSIDENTLFHACRLAARDANYTRGNDYILCATRRDLTVENDTEYRVFGFLRFLCAPNPSGFNSAIFEDRLDDVSLLIAHVLAFGFGVDNDDIEGCNSEDNFLMSRFNRVPFDPATITNPWNMSNCTTSGIVERIARFNMLNANCLLDNDFTDAEFNARLVDQPLAGEIYDVDFQCAYRFGIGTTACIGPDETSITNVGDLCHIGVYCNVSGECSNATRSRVLNGTPCGQNKICFKNLCEDTPGSPADLCEECTNSTECPGNATCDPARNICLCIEGFSIRECGVCVENRDLGENCSDGVDCADECAVCDPKDKVCVCFGETFDNNTAQVVGGVCSPKVNNTEMCPQADACLDNNAFCNSMNVCECNPNFVLDSNNVCVPVTIPGVICQPCLDDSNCTIANTECVEVDGSKICKCKFGFFLNMCGVCTEKTSLGGNCSGDAICADPNAVCTPDDICVCFEGTFDNNTSGVPGGTCLPKIPTGDPCPSDNTDGVCLDENAICNGSICVCRDGFKLNASGICVPLLGLCEICVEDNDCGGEFTECIDDGMGMGKICRCIQTHSVNKCGVCIENRPLGSNCSDEVECADPNAVCTPNDICECFGDTYDNNTAAVSGGICVPKIPTGDPCPPDNTEDVCLDKNAVCNGTICACGEGFKLNSSGVCVPLVGVCEPCVDNHDCGGEFTECIDDGMGMGKICRCMPTHFVNKCGVCTEKPPLGGNCSGEAICADPNAVCTPDDICVCFEDTYDNNTSGMADGTCLPKIPTGDPCPPDNTDDVCKDENAMCNGTICVCRDGFKLNASDICVPFLDLCEPCVDNHDCGGEFTECVDDGMGMGKMCRCIQTHFVNMCGVCTEKPPVGGNCSGEAICADPNAVCTPNDICVCFEHAYDNNTSGMPGGTCLPKIPTGDPCPPDNTDEVCRDENAICNGTICVCKDGFKLNTSDICVPLLDGCEPCTNNNDCGGEFTECADDGKGLGLVCRCIQTHFADKCGECQEKILLGGNCSHNAECNDTNAVCPNDICICFGDTYDNNGTDTPGGMCVPKEPNGDPCDQEDACLDVNAECNGTICVCKEGFVITASNECVPGNVTTPFPETGLCDPCENDSDCEVSNTFCKDLGATKECRCNDGFFVNKCGECEPDVELGGNCTDNKQCSDPNAICGPGDICVCFNDTYDNNGDHPGGMCIPKEPIGDPCNQTDACLDLNAACINDVCTCKDRFVLNAMNVCVPGNDTTVCPEELCSPCTDNTNCTLPNTTCDQQTGECRCKDGFFVDACGDCKPDVELGGNCTDIKQCSDPNAVCGPGEICVCFNDTYDNNGDHPGGMCVPKEPNGDPCNQTDACLDVNAACINDVCTCKDGFLLNTTNVCVPENDTTVCPKELCSPCTDNTNCTLPNTTCDQQTGECRCKDGFFVDVCGDCKPNVEIGGNCTDNKQCSDPNAVCGPGDICVCFNDTYDNNGDHPGGLCIIKEPNGEPCNQTDACLDVNAACINDVCTCKDGFVLNAMNVCVLENDTTVCPEELCSPCTDNANCTLPNTTCDQQTGECRCKDGFFVDVCGDCKPKVGLGSNCSMDSMCLDPQAVCDPEIDECVCFSDFYDDNFCTVPGGTCDRKKEVGEICVLPNSCLDPNANCSLTSVCKCNPGFFPNDQLQCVPLLPPGSSCDDNDQCVENAECDDEDQECACEVGFQEECGECVTADP